MVIVYWHWFVLAMLLMMAELLIPTFFILWFGLGAMITGAVLWLFPELWLSGQLLVWLIASIGFVCVWFFYVKPTMVDKTQAGISKEALMGQVGLVIQAPDEGQERGQLRFTVPVLGNEEWPFLCEQAVIVGDRVRVKSLSGNTLVVVKHQ